MPAITSAASAPDPRADAAAVAYFASEAASYVTGTTLPLDGGGATSFPLTRPPAPA